MKFYKATLVIADNETPVTIAVPEGTKIPNAIDDETLIFLRVEQTLSVDEIKANHLSVLFPKAGTTIRYLLDLPGYESLEVPAARGDSSYGA